MEAENNHSPILVTGAHRSGTTWVGKMLCSGGEAVYISEPLNIWHRAGVLGVPVKQWYQYICRDNQEEFLPAFEELLRFDYHTFDEIRSLRNIKDLGRFFRDWRSFYTGRRRASRVLLKDPFAVFSAPWFFETLGCAIVIMVRHPAAFASSLKRLNWSFDFSHLLAQDFLMRDHLNPFKDEMRSIMNGNEVVTTQAGLLWRMIYSVVDEYRSGFQNFLIVRHEDLSTEPQIQFHKMYQELGLSYTKQVEKVISSSSDAENPAERPEMKPYATQLNSQGNLKNWKNHLTQQEIAQVRRLTEDTAPAFYADDTWE